MDLKLIPRSAPKDMLPGLKLQDLVQTRGKDFSQDKCLATKTLERGMVGRVKRIYDMGRHCKQHRFLIYIRISGHPVTTFYSEELSKVKV